MGSSPAVVCNVLRAFVCLGRFELVVLPAQRDYSWGRPVGLVQGSHKGLSRSQGHQSDHILEKRFGFLRSRPQIPPGSCVSETIALVIPFYSYTYYFIRFGHVYDISICILIALGPPNCVLWEVWKRLANMRENTSSLEEGFTCVVEMVKNECCYFPKWLSFWGRPLWLKWSLLNRYLLCCLWI